MTASRRFQHLTDQELDWVNSGLRLIYPGKSWKAWQSLVREVMDEKTRRRGEKREKHPPTCECAECWQLMEGQR